MNAALNGTRRALRLGTGLATCVSCMVFAQSALAQSMPELSNAGGASISLGGNTLSIDALAADRVINWQTFSVASGNTVSFTSTDGIGNAVATPVTVINRVIGKDVGGTTTFFPSLINGSITATDNISLWLINPSGVLFGASGAFNGGSLVVSTLDFKGAPPGTRSSDRAIARLRLQAGTW
ncbi:MAG: filamentous hemagglutinin N-terminal domain-containing protein [Novosphingobium meiothermophilum]